MIDRNLTRRGALTGGLAGIAATLLACSPAKTAAPAPAPAPPAAQPRFAELEKQFGGRLGLFAVDTGSGASTGYRSDERFLMCSTVKSLLAATVLHRSTTDPGLLDRRIRYTRADVLEYAPVTSAHVADGMTVAQLCDAAVTVSDNTAANLLFAQLGGPSAVTAFARSLGDTVTRSDRLETALNEGAPGDERDTTTPRAFVATLRRVTVDPDPLTEGQRARLNGWLAGCTTGPTEIRAGVPAGWPVGDKTGNGFAGEYNDVAVVRPPGRAPLVLAVYTVAAHKDDTAGKATVIAGATRIALDALGARS